MAMSVANRRGITSTLHLASLNGHTVDTIRLLLKFKADPNFQSDDGVDTSLSSMCLDMYTVFSCYLLDPNLNSQVL